MNYQQQIKRIEYLSTTPIQDITCGNYHSIALCENQKGIWVWGRSTSCNLGTNLPKQYKQYKQHNKNLNKPQNKNNNNNIKFISQNQQICQPQYINIMANKISAGNEHSYIWKQNDVYCWGSNKQYKLGLQQEKQYQLTKSQIFIQANQTDMQLYEISCGDSHSLAVFKLKEQKQIGYQIYAWGQSKSYQLALQAEGAVSQPIMIDFNQPIKHIYSRSDFNFILTLNGDCYSWGTNLFGRLGFPNSIKNQKIPTQIKILTKIQTIAMGKYHCIGITQKLQAYSWGHGMHGQLGLNQILSQTTPTKIQISQHIVQASCGEYHSIILTDRNQIMSCGSNAYHALGHSQIDAKKRCKKFVKINIELEQDFIVKKIASGNRHNLLLTHDGRVYSWGCNKYGQLGRFQNTEHPKLNIKRQLYKQSKLQQNLNLPKTQQQQHNNNKNSSISQIKQNKLVELKQGKIQQQISLQKRLINWKQRYEKFKAQKQQQQHKFMLQLQQILKQNNKNN